MNAFMKGITRWLIFWGGRTMNMFAYDFIKNVTNKMGLQYRKESCGGAYLDHWLDYSDELLYYIPEIISYLADEPKGNKLVFAHPNLNIDNGFFYRSETDGQTVECGALDFGSYCCFPVSIFSGIISGADQSYYIKNADKLFSLLTTDYNTKTPTDQKLVEASVIEDVTLFLMIKYLLLGGIALKIRMDKLATYPQLKQITSEKDPLIADDFDLRVWLKMVSLAPERMEAHKMQERFQIWARKNYILLGASREHPTKSFKSSIMYGPLLRKLHSTCVWPMVWLYHRGKLGLTAAALSVCGIAVTIPLAYSLLWK
jgi:hypothetical protein